MKIAFQYFSTHLGGQQIQILNLARCFNSLGHDVVWLYEEKGAVLEEFIKYGNPISIPINKNKILNKFYISRSFLILYNLLKKFFFLKKYFQLNTPELIISSDSLMSLIIGKSVRSLNIKHFRLIGQDLQEYEKVFRFYKILNIDRYIKFYFGWPLVYQSLLKKGVLEKKLAIFQYNAVDTSKFYPFDYKLRIKVKENLGFLKDEFIIGWVGRIEKINQAKNTLSLGKQLLDLGFSDFKILFVGGGLYVNGNEDLTYINEFKEDAISLGLSENIIFSGWVDSNLIVNYLNIMDVVPMLEMDPSGGSILREAMASGSVALSVDGPSKSQREFMKPNNSILVSHENFIYEAAKEIIKLRKNPKRIKEIQKNAKIFSINNLSFENQANEILSYYNE